jgi:hypothetical protein
MLKTKQLLGYLAMHLDATVQFYATDMVMNIHLDASYLSEANAHSRACGHFIMEWKPDPTKPIKLYGAFVTLCAIMLFVVASAAEAELGALFLNCKQATIFRLTLKEMEHPQPPTPIHYDNSTAVGIPNNIVKRQQLRLMEMLSLMNVFVKNYVLACQSSLQFMQVMNVHLQLFWMQILRHLLLLLSCFQLEQARSVALPSHCLLVY